MAFDGPNSLDCYIQLWFSAGCIDTGSKVPYRLSDAEIDVLHHSTVRYLKSW